MSVAHRLPHDVYDIGVHAVGRPGVYARLDAALCARIDAWPHAEAPHLIVLYATTDALDRDGLVSCSALGSAMLAHNGGDLVDVTGTRQGSVTVSLSRPLPSPGLPARPICERAIAEDSRWYDRASRRAFDAHRQVFYSVRTCLGDLPMVALPVMSTLVPRNDAFLRRCLGLARELLGGATGAEVFALAATLPSGGQLYVNDFARARGGKADTEEWSALLAYPRPMDAAFDCEDGCLMVQALVHAYQSSEAEDLAEARRFWQRYSCASVQGDLRTSGGWVAHSYCVCLDARAVEAWRTGSPVPDALLPTLVLESTSWQSAVWSIDEFAKPAPARPVIDRSDPLLRRCCRVRESAKDASSAYGAVAKMQFARHLSAQGPQALSFAVLGPRGAMDVPLRTLACAPHKVAPALLSSADTAQLAAELAALPAWRFPEVKMQTKHRRSAGLRPARAMLQVRRRDWPRVRHKLRAAVRDEVTLADAQLAADDDGFVCVTWK